MDPVEERFRDVDARFKASASVATVPCLHAGVDVPDVAIEKHRKDQARAYRQTMRTRKIYSSARERFAMLKPVLDLEISPVRDDVDEAVRRRRCITLLKLRSATATVYRSTQVVLKTGHLVDQLWECRYLKAFTERFAVAAIEAMRSADLRQLREAIASISHDAEMTQADHGGDVNLSIVRSCCKTLARLLDACFDVPESIDSYMSQLKQDNVGSDPGHIQKRRAEVRGMFRDMRRDVIELRRYLVSLAKVASVMRTSNGQDGDDGKGNPDAGVAMFKRLVQTRAAGADQLCVDALEQLHEKLPEDTIRELVEILASELRGEAIEGACRDEVVGIVPDDEVDETMDLLEEVATSECATACINANVDAGRLEEVPTLVREDDRSLSETLLRAVKNDCYMVPRSPSFGSSESEDLAMVCQCGASFASGLHFCTKCGDSRGKETNQPSSIQPRHQKDVYLPRPARSEARGQQGFCERDDSGRSHSPSRADRGTGFESLRCEAATRIQARFRGSVTRKTLSDVRTVARRSRSSRQGGEAAGGGPDRRPQWRRVGTMRLNIPTIESKDLGALDEARQRILTSTHMDLGLDSPTDGQAPPTPTSTGARSHLKSSPTRLPMLRNATFCYPAAEDANAVSGVEAETGGKLPWLAARCRREHALRQRGCGRYIGWLREHSSRNAGAAHHSKTSSTLNGPTCSLLLAEATVSPLLSRLHAPSGVSAGHRCRNIFSAPVAPIKIPATAVARNF